MAQPQKEPLRTLSEQEERELKRLAKATSERQDVVWRAKALVAVASGQRFTEAARAAGLTSGDGVSKLVSRFNQHGLAALSIAPGTGRKPTYTSEQRARILAEVHREPDRQADQTATWSLMTLRGALRKTRSARDRCRNDPPDAARGGLSLPAHGHLDPYRLCLAQAQKWHGDDL